MFQTITTINGRFVRRGQDKISVFDNSLLYAEGLFETFLAIDDRVVFGNEHLRRLRRGAKVIGLEIPVSSSRLASWMTRTLRRHPDRIKKLRLTMTSGEAARWIGKQGRPQVILSASPHQLPTTPYSLFVSPYRVDQDSIFRRIKTISYAIHAAALKQAHTRRCDDALLVNTNGHVAEVTSANIFWVRRGRVYTPPIAAGCLEGITRMVVIKESRKLGLDVTEKNITLDNMLKADEIFISSSLKLVVSVSRIRDGRRVHKLPTGPVTQLLAQRFRYLIKID
ncbi:MAG: aminotransferase class IV [candidate division Zixibacteria bacterium]|nr:aminotransferase class IV [candidate division Zixibacteria bacterium]